MERTYSQGGRLAGLVLILIGVAFLFSGILSLTFWVVGRLIWPVALAAVGAVFLERQCREYRTTGRMPFPWPLFLLLGGIGGVLRAFGIAAHGYAYWPLILVAIGIWLLMNRR